jgi:hypothetical protein
VRERPVLELGDGLLGQGVIAMPLISLDGIPPTTDAAFAPALAAGTDNPPRRSRNPADSASRSAGTRPAADTKFGSSKTGRIA